MSRRVSDYYPQKRRRSVSSSRKTRPRSSSISSRGSRKGKYPSSKRGRFSNKKKRGSYKRKKKNFSRAAKRATVKASTWSGGMNKYKYQRVENFVVPVNSANIEPCFYGYPGLVITEPIGICDIPTILAMASASYTQSNPLNPTAHAVANSFGLTRKIKVWDQRLVHEMVNMSNAPCTIVGYMCLCRNQLGFGSSQSEPKNLLGEGFNQMGIETYLDPTAGNLGLTNALYSPFDSPKFTATFKILRTRTKVLNGGDRCRFLLKKAKPTLYDPNHFVKFVAGTDVNLASNRVVSTPRGFRFWLFKIRGALGMATPVLTDFTVQSFSLPQVACSSIYSSNYSALTVPQTITQVTGAGISTAAVQIRENVDEDMKAASNIV